MDGIRIMMPSRNSHGTKIFTSDGAEIIGASRISVVAEIDQPVRADIEFQCIDVTTIQDAQPTFRVGTHTDVVAVVTSDNRVLSLGTGKRLGLFSINQGGES